MKLYINANTNKQLIKLSDAEFNRFLEIADDYGEFLFGDEEEIKIQLERALNFQGYWSGVQYRIYFDTDNREFYVESKW